MFPMEELVAAFISGEVANYLKREVANCLKQDRVVERILRQTETQALQMLADIRKALNDDQLDDPECFRRIEAIMAVYEAEGIAIGRHDW